MAADRLGITGEAARQFGSVAGHHETSRSALALCCVEAVNRLRDGAQSHLRNITLGATYSALCAVEHKTDAATGEHGDLLDVIRESCGFLEFRDVFAEARRFLSLPRSEREAELASPTTPAPSGSSESARRLFGMSKPIHGTLAEAYLRTRGISALSEATSLRFHPRCYYRPDCHLPIETWPALIAAVTTLDGVITGVHRTWLDPSGRGKAPIETPRRAMGLLLGNAVRFGVPNVVLAAGEGIETMLSLRCALPILPMVSALSANHLAAIVLPPGLRRLYIARDADAAGHAMAAVLMERAETAGIAAIALSPRLGDFNEDLRFFGVGGLRAGLRGQLVPQDALRFLSQGAAIKA
jgi:hypothetical protein